ncbi:MAG TPA: hypothetical protein VHX38_02605 [Pseudonocardiaceae bacterium]|jgi:hypothetical protein|nr:hypothetical protein [Pseudonocardiaceae bacterium]
MYSLATGTAAIYRGTTETAFGDEVASIDPSDRVAAGVLVSIQETTKRAWDPATQTVRVVRTYECSVQSDTDLRTNDVLVEDGPGGRTFQVTSSSQGGGWAWTSDLNVELKRIDLSQQGG